MAQCRHWSDCSPGRGLPGQLGTDAWTKDCETYPKQCAYKQTGTLFTVFPTKSTHFHYVNNNWSWFPVCIFTAIKSQHLFIRFEKTYPFLTKMPSDPKWWQRCALPRLKKKSTLSHRFFFFFFFFVQASVPSCWPATSSAPPPHPRGLLLTYDLAVHCFPRSVCQTF